MSDVTETPQIVLCTLDLDTGTGVLSRSDGMEARFPLRGGVLAGSSSLSRVHWTPDGSGLLAVTRGGDEVVFEMPRRAGPDGPDDRLVVYLDQNQWSLLARCAHARRDVPKPDLAAAEQLADWVHQRRVVLPASAGHYVETTKWRDPDRRYRLGLTVLQLSRGWQMRDPLAVRRDEIYNAFRAAFAEGEGVRDSPVFTLRPNVLPSAVRGEHPAYAAPGDFPPDAAHVLEALVYACALIDVMLDDEHIEPGADSGWSLANQQFSDWLDGETRDSQQKRRSIDMLLLSDLRLEIAEEAHAAGATPEQVSEWIRKDFSVAFRVMRATGLFRELLHEKHLNKGSRWESNDLTDMVYLSCAAGYADIVVCERFTAAALNRSQGRLGRRVNTFRNLREAVPAISDALAAKGT